MENHLVYLCDLGHVSVLAICSSKMGMTIASIHLTVLRMSALPLQSADNNVCFDEPRVCHVIGVHYIVCTPKSTH